MKISCIVFDDSSKDSVLDLFGKTVDSDGFIVEKENEAQRVLTKEGQEIMSEEWAGVMKSSEEFVKSDTLSLIEMAKRLE